MKVLLVCGLNRALSPFQLSHALQISIGNKCNAKQHIKSSLARELHKHTHTHICILLFMCLVASLPAWSWRKLNETITDCIATVE